MKICILSDLHIEFEPFDMDFSHCDLVILAGDIHVKNRGVDCLKSLLPEIPVLYVLGNHEFYGKAYPKLVDDLKEQTKNSNIHILEKDIFRFNGYNFLGCTLWTNFELFGDPRLSGYQCQQLMTDFKKIRLSPKYSKLRSIDVAAIHRHSISWLKNSLAQLKEQNNIVISHHAPSLASVPEQYRNDVISASYASDLRDFISEYQPKYWIHGHTHTSSSYGIGHCKVICNPKGYPGEENPTFDKNFTLEI